MSDLVRLGLVVSAVAAGISLVLVLSAAVAIAVFGGLLIGGIALAGAARPQPKLIPIRVKSRRK